MQKTPRYTKKNFLGQNSGWTGEAAHYEAYHYNETNYKGKNMLSSLLSARLHHHKNF